MRHGAWGMGSVRLHETSNRCQADAGVIIIYVLLPLDADPDPEPELQPQPQPNPVQAADQPSTSQFKRQRNSELYTQRN